MKTIKKMMALVIAMVMTLTIVSSAFAAVGDKLAAAESTIIAENVQEGDSVAYYQVVEWKEGSGWALKAPFNTIDGLTVEALTAANGITDAIAASIAAAATGDGTLMTPGDGNPTPKTTFTATSVAPGLYYLKAKPIASVDTVYNPAFVSADYYEGGNSVSFGGTIGNTAVLKSSTITFDKDVAGADKFKDTKPGDIIPYVITTQIPSYGDTFTNPTFSITDTFSEGLELELDTVKEVAHPITVAYGNNSTTATNDDVTITATDGGNTFTVAFTNDYLTGLAGEQPRVTITYYGLVNTRALKNVTYMDNEAVLTYSNTPTTTDSKDDITRHYTFTIDGSLLGGTDEVTDELIKIGVKPDGTPITQTTTTHHSTAVSPLDGATFSLSPVSPTTMGDPNPRSATSKDGGYLTFTGLDAGSYTLVETAAPSGYIKDDRTFTVTITPHWNASIPDLLDSYDIVFTNDKDQTTATASFTMTNTGETKKTTGSGMPTNGVFPKNTQGTGLPSTGGMGTTIFYVIGGLLVLAAAIVLISRRRVQQ